MGVTSGSLDLGVSEQFSDHWQTLADQQPAAGETMPKVMDADVFEIGTRPDAAPRVLKVGEVVAQFPVGKPDLGRFQVHVFPA